LNPKIRVKYFFFKERVKYYKYILNPSYSYHIKIIYETRDFYFQGEALQTITPFVLK